MEAADGKLATNDTTIVWTVRVNDDGTYGFEYNGQRIGMGAEYTSMTLGAVNNYWTLEDAGNDCFYIKNPVRTAYMQWYVDKGYYSAYYYINAGQEDRFAMQFYAVDGGGEAPCTHEWGEGVATTAATCTTDGEMTYTCGKCGNTKTEPIAMLGHDLTTTDNVHYSCTRCDYTETRSGEGYTAITSASEITNGDYIFVAQLGEKYYVLTNNTSEVTNALYGPEIAVNADGSISKEKVTDAMVFTLTMGTTGYTAANGTNYITHTQGGTQVKMTTSGTEFVFADATNGITMRSTLDSDRYITLRLNGKPQFRCYKDVNLGGPTHGEYNGYLMIYKVG